jgi:methionyl-tRNA synthetase
MPERIFIGVAWPYANGQPHLGHIAGAYLPADIFARYHRLKGNQVLMVSGSDQHGTPITLQAEQENVSPQQVVDKYHASFVEAWKGLGIEFDLFTTTGTENHKETVHSLLHSLQEKGYIYEGMMLLPYCEDENRFLPDRYVEGTCPFCKHAGARGDQCDNCGNTLDPKDLIDIRCRICGNNPVIRESKHLFMRLTAFEKPLLDWVNGQTHWRPNVLNFTRKYLEGGLRDRAITRDISWGIPTPVAGFEGKRIYVWFEAVIGYLSASKEWAQQQGNPELWREFWEQDSKSYYFIGKDNIPFHSIIWPAMLMGNGNLNLPYDVPANEFLNLEGRQLSTSRNWAVWVPDYLERYSADSLRYYLTAAMPETSDSDFSWREYVRRNNDELVATYGNLIHRVLTFTYRNYESKVPDPGPLKQQDQVLLSRAKETFDKVSEHLHACHFRQGIQEVMALAQMVNRYLDEQAPWKTIKEDRLSTATTLWTALSVIANLKTLAYPFLPFSSEKLHQMLGFPGSLKDSGWQPQPLLPGQILQDPSPLFTKLEPTVVDEETRRLRVSSGELVS